MSAVVNEILFRSSKFRLTLTRSFVHPKNFCSPCSPSSYALTSVWRTESQQPLMCLNALKQKRFVKLNMGFKHELLQAERKLLTLWWAYACLIKTLSLGVITTTTITIITIIICKNDIILIFISQRSPVFIGNSGLGTTFITRDNLGPSQWYRALESMECVRYLE